jgi:predicted RNase H-like nuclease
MSEHVAGRPRAAVHVAAGRGARHRGLMGDRRVLGIDACKRGWIAIAVDDAVCGAYFAVDIAALIARARADGPLGVIAIDMPIGLPDRGHRQADVLARAQIGPLWPSVFMTPVRQALLAADHAAASAINRELAGQGISVQAFGLKPKLFQVDRWVRQASVRVVEIHPEVCFARLAGAPLTARKSSWAGAERRRELLASAGIRLAGDLDGAGAYAGVDDVLDAGAAAWAARQVLHGRAKPMPDPPETFSDGWPCAIWT